MNATPSSAAERVLVRAAQDADVDGIVRVHVESAEDSYAPLARAWPAADVEQRRAHWATRINAGLRGEVQRVDVVAWLAGSIVGFCSGGPAREAAHGAERTEVAYLWSEGSSHQPQAEPPG